MVEITSFRAIGMVDETVLPTWLMATTNFSAGISSRVRRCSSM